MAIYKSKFTGEQVDRAVGYALDLGGTNLNAVFPKFWLPFQKYANTDNYRNYIPSDYGNKCSSVEEGDRYVTLFTGNNNDWWNTKGVINAVGRFLFTEKGCSFAFNIKPDISEYGFRRVWFECSEGFDHSAGRILNVFRITLNQGSSKSILMADITVNGNTIGASLVEFDNSVLTDGSYHNIVVTQGVYDSDIITRIFLDGILIMQRDDVPLLYEAVGKNSNISVFTTNGQNGYDYKGYTKDFIFYNADISTLMI